MKDSRQLDQSLGETNSVRELIGVRELASRLGKHRTTIYQWMATGVLREGQHYRRLNGRTCLFPWPRILHLLLGAASPTGGTAGQASCDEARPSSVLEGRSTVRINLDY